MEARGAGSAQKFYTRNFIKHGAVQCPLVSFSKNPTPGQNFSENLWNGRAKAGFVWYNGNCKRGPPQREAEEIIDREGCYDDLTW